MDQDETGRIFVVLTDFSTMSFLPDKEMLRSNLKKLVSNPHTESMPVLGLQIPKPSTISKAAAKKLFAVTARNSSNNILKEGEIQYIAYLAPEMVARLRNSRFLNVANVIKSVSDDDWKKTDIYSLGILMFELLTESKAWSGHAPEQIEEYIDIGKRPTFSEAILGSNDNVIRTLRETIERCWIGEPAMRISTQEVEQALLGLDPAVVNDTI
jgi:serine/threonine protein kinase